MKGDNKVYISRKKDLGTPYFDFFESDKGLEIVCHSCDDPDVIDNAKILINNVSRDGERFYILSGLHGRMWDDWLHHHLKLYVGTPSKLEAVGNPKFHHETEYSTIDFEYDGEHGRYIFHKKEGDRYCDCELALPFPGDLKELERFQLVKDWEI